MRLSVERIVTILLMAVAAGSLMRLGRAADGQVGPATNLSASQIATLDMGRLFKEARGFTEDLREVHEGVSEAQQQFNKEGQALAFLTAELGKLTAGSKEHVDLQQQITTEQAKLKAKIDRRKARTITEEAEVYSSHFMTFQGHINEYAKQRGLRLVLRFNGAPMNPDEPKSVLESLNRFVVFQDQLDITDDILQIVNKD